MIEFIVSGEKNIDRLIFKIEKRVESYQSAVEATMEYARGLILKRVESGNLSDGTPRWSKSKEKYGRYSVNYGKYDRSKKGLPTSKVTLKHTGGLFNNFLITKSAKINLRNRLYKRTLYFSDKKAKRSNGKFSDITYSDLADRMDEMFGNNFNLSQRNQKLILEFFKKQIQK